MYKLIGIAIFLFMFSATVYGQEDPLPSASEKEKTTFLSIDQIPNWEISANAVVSGGLIQDKEGEVLSRKLEGIQLDMWRRLWRSFWIGIEGEKLKS